MTVTEGSKLSFLITIINHGPDDANDVHVDDLLPAGFVVTYKHCPVPGAATAVSDGLEFIYAKIRARRGYDCYVDGHFNRRDQTASNTAKLDLAYFASYQSPNKHPDESSINMKVVK